jgi:predicted alpha/beta-hydrolase family hydrolase
MVILVKMPLNLAVLNPNKAEEIIAAHPKIEHWAVGGHSLGGAMAAKFVDDLPGAADSLVLWAAYPANNSSLRDQPGLKVLSIYGSLDALATPEKILSASSILPANTSWVEIQGGNHAQFGSYGSQPGDNLPLLVPEDQWAQVVSATTGFLKTLNNK